MYTTTMLMHAAENDAACW